MIRPNPTTGMRHVALFVTHFEACRHFYCDLLGMKVVWEPDADNLYLSSGHDNLALHRAKPDFIADNNQRLDHIGFFLAEKSDVDAWHTYLVSEKAAVKMAPKDHRDGARSFYCADPDGNHVQMIYYPF